MQEQSPADVALSPHRSEALTDGIFAVAMTLLVIDLKLPDHLAVHGVDDFAQALANLLPKFIAWSLSFFVLSFFWVGHHRAFRYVRRTDGPLLALNLGQLAAVSLLPFSCSLIGEHAGFLLSQIVYAINLAALGFLALFINRHIHRRPELGPVPMPRPTYEGARMRIVGLIVISVASVLIAVVAPKASNMAFALMGVINPLSRRRERRQIEAGRAAEITTRSS
jgi:uncharacterized membrane protein